MASKGRRPSDLTIFNRADPSLVLAKILEFLEDNGPFPFCIFGGMKAFFFVPLFLLIPLLPASSQDTLATADSSASDTSFQDRLVLMNGNEMEVEVIEVGMGAVSYLQMENGDTGTRSIPIAEVFSVDREGKEERILYEQDSTRGNTLDRREMRFFIRGERDAMEGFRTPWTTTAGLAIGAAGGYFLELSLFTFTVPLVFTVGSTVPKIHIDEATVSDPAYLDREFYLKGYEKEARGRRMLNALKSSAGGVLLGMAVYVLINPDQLR